MNNGLVKGKEYGDVKSIPTRIRGVINSIPFSITLALSGPTIAYTQEDNTQLVRMLEYEKDNLRMERNLAIGFAGIILLVLAYQLLQPSPKYSNSDFNEEKKNLLDRIKALDKKFNLQKGELDTKRREIIDLQKVNTRQEGEFQRRLNEIQGAGATLYEELIGDVLNLGIVSGSYEPTHYGVLELIQDITAQSGMRISQLERELVSTRDDLHALEENDGYIALGEEMRVLFDEMGPRLSSLLGRENSSGRILAGTVARFNQKDITSLNRRYALALDQVAGVMDLETQNSWLPRIILAKEAADACIADGDIKGGISLLVGATVTIEYVLGFFQGDDGVEEGGSWDEFLNTPFAGENSGIIINDNQKVSWLNDEFENLNLESGGIIDAFGLLNIEFTQIYNEKLAQEFRDKIKPLLKKYVVRKDTEESEEYSLVNGILNTLKQILKSEESFNDYIEGLQKCYPDRY